MTADEGQRFLSSASFASDFDFRMRGEQPLELLAGDAFVVNDQGFHG
jgi:hypothetical protein